jgi:hypothetical protein
VPAAPVVASVTVAAVALALPKEARADYKQDACHILNYNDAAAFYAHMENYIPGFGGAVYQQAILYATIEYPNEWQGWDQEQWDTWIAAHMYNTARAYCDAT